MNIRLTASHKLSAMAFVVALLGTGIQSSAQEAPIVHGVPFKTGVQSASAPAGAHLTYYSGPVVSNVQVRIVLWGTATNPILASNLPGYYTGITNSVFYDMFSEYATNITAPGGVPGTNQSIGRGSYAGITTIAPSRCATATTCTLTDPQIQSELIAQLTANNLPQPQYDLSGNVNTEYMIYFPPNVHISQGGSPSCQAGGFCAYHGTVMYNSKFLPYSVIPDFGPGSGCDVGCGTGTQIQNVESVSSHELIETVTDVAVGFATVVGTSPYLSWYDGTNGEIGDICNGQQSIISTPTGTYTVQQEFINSLSNCVASGPHPKFSLTSAASSVGTPFILTVTAQNPTTGTHTAFAGTAHFTSTDPNAVLPGDYVFVPSDHGVHNFNVTLNTVGKSVTATETVNPLITGTVTPATAAGFTISAPATKTIGQGDFATYLVTETPSGGFAGAVTLSVTGLPAGTSSGFTTNPFTGSSAMYIVTHSTTALGTYPLTITGTSGAITHSIVVSLVITAHGPVDFALAATPPTQTVTQGNSAVYTVTETPAGGFAGTVTLVAINVPTGATATFATNPFTGSTTMTVSTTASTPLGTYQIAIGGYSGSLLHTTPVNLKVQ